MADGIVGDDGQYCFGIFMSEIVRRTDKEEIGGKIIKGTLSDVMDRNLNVEVRKDTSFRFLFFFKKYFYFTLVFHKINTKFVALKCRVEIV